MPKTKDAVSFVERWIAEDPELRRMVEHAQCKMHLAQQIYDLRTRGKLTQEQLAELVGIRPSIITRLEDANYDGPSVAMLGRIAAALDAELRIELVPVRSKRAKARPSARRATARRS